MSFKNEQGIVPQLARHVGLRLRQQALVVLLGASVGLTACSSVKLQSSAPPSPATLDEARAYVAKRDKQLEVLDYELNQATIACYDRFFVSSCLDDVRLKGAQLRRSHLEALGAASDMIRLDDYAKRRSSNKPVQPGEFK